MKRGAGVSGTYEGPVAAGLWFTADALRIDLTDGRSVRVPLEFYPTLVGATPRERREWKMIGRGIGFTWDRLDLQLSTEGIVAGRREHVIPAGFRAWLAGEQRRLGMDSAA